MKDIELLPCPFCGAACHFEKDEGAWEWVECESCGMQGNRSASLMDDCKPILAAAWNRRAAIEADRAQRVPDVDAMADKIAECLHGTYHCNRVWEAWHVGTMSQDDFEPVDESETPREIAEEIVALLASTPAPAQQEPNAVAYLDIGAGGYMDLGTDMSDEALSLLPKGRHMLVIAGTYGVDGYTAAQHQEQPQQERRPMTEQEFEVLHCKEKGYVTTGLMDIVAMVERHHGIKG